MSDNSTIEWTDATWNPVRGCTKISPGCQHCYAQTFAERFRGVKGHPYELGFDVRLAPDKLVEPIRWRRPRMVFVNSMSDLFHEAVPDEFIVDVARVMELSEWHVFQVLTKRADRMAHLLRTKLQSAAAKPHIWWGVSVEDRRYGLPRLELLRSVPARVRFLSVEPLLEDLGALKVTGIDWVIVGGESGPSARPMASEWVTKIQRTCKAGSVPFFFKQWGGYPKKKAGRLLGGHTFDEMPPRPRAVVPSSAEYQTKAAEANHLEVRWMELPVVVGHSTQLRRIASAWWPRRN
jgi:protein gp37